MWKPYNPNPVGRSVGDCAVRAIAKALDVTWEKGQSYAYAPADIYADKSYRRSYRGGSYRGNSMAGYSNRRNSMGRYSRDGFTEQLEQLMNEAPNEQVRNKLQTMLDQM